MSQSYPLPSGTVYTDAATGQFTAPSGATVAGSGGSPPPPPPPAPPPQRRGTKQRLYMLNR